MERIRLGQTLGKTRDQIVAELVANGLSKPVAERFVERALTADAGGSAPTSPQPTKDHDGEAAEDPAGRRALISGAFWLSLGVSVTGATYALAKPGEEYVLAHGAVIVGVIAFARGLYRWLSTPHARFPTGAVALAGGLPLLGAAGTVGVVEWRAARAVQAQRDADDQRAETARAADAARAREEAALAARQAAAAAQAEARAAYVRELLERLADSSKPGTQCDAALALSRAGAREAIPQLVALLREKHGFGTGSCAARALLDLGEMDTVLAFFVEASRSPDLDQRLAALEGLGRIGPPAAPVGLPVLEESLRSSAPRDRRWAAWALARLGAAAEPLLETASRDPDATVREEVAKGLKALRERPVSSPPPP